MDSTVGTELETAELWKSTTKAMDKGGSDIKKFYSGTTVLVTGGTGFLGKLLVEKILRCCPEIHRLYLLTRPKKDKDTTKRLEEQFDDVLYDRLREERPDFIEKIAIIKGDMGEIDLGLSPEDRTKVMNEVEIIFHGAATVKFDEPLKKAVEINVRGTREMWQLARACGKLKSLVYISTAYSNCMFNEIEEKFYKNPLSGDKLIEMIETVDENNIKNNTLGILGDYPNTYVYTKAAAEDIVLKYSKGLPVALIRPSIIIATAKEPVAGWIDNVYGPTGIVVGATAGVLHVLHCNPSLKADLVPGDMVINVCIAIAWKTAKEYTKNYEDIPNPDLSPTVYNFVSSEQQPLTWKHFMTYTESYFFKMPNTKNVYYYVFHLTPYKTIYRLYSLFLHWIPAYILDGIAVLIGKQLMLRKTYRKINKFCEVLSYFVFREWKFCNKNVNSLYTELCDADKLIFNFDFNHFNWSDYLYNYVRGIRIYLLKDPLDTLPAAITRQKKFKCLHYFLCFVLLSLLLKLFWSVFYSSFMYVFTNRFYL